MRHINRLTKKALMELPTGSYIVSNTCRSGGGWAYEYRVMPQAQREQQWKDIVFARAAGRSFRLYPTPEDCAKEMQTDWDKYKKNDGQFRSQFLQTLH